MTISDIIRMLEEVREHVGDVEVYFSEADKKPVPCDKKLRAKIELAQLGVRRNGEAGR